MQRARKGLKRLTTIRKKTRSTWDIWNESLMASGTRHEPAKPATNQGKEGAILILLGKGT